MCLVFGSSHRVPSLVVNFQISTNQWLLQTHHFCKRKTPSVIYCHISQSTHDFHTHTADTQDKFQILYPFWYPSLSMAVFHPPDLFCVILSRWIGQNCGESIRTRGRGLTEISVTATPNPNRMSDELTVNVGEGSRSSRTDGGVPLIPTFWKLQVWVYDQDEEEYLRRLSWIPDGLIKVNIK